MRGVLGINAVGNCSAVAEEWSCRHEEHPLSGSAVGGSGVRWSDRSR